MEGHRCDALPYPHSPKGQAQAHKAQAWVVCYQAIYHLERVTVGCLSGATKQPHTEKICRP